MKATKMLLVVGAAMGLTLIGCEEKNNPVTKAADAAKGAAGKAADGMKDAAKSATDAAAKGVDAVKDAGHTVTEKAGEIKDAAKDAAHAAGDKLKELQASGTKWLTETVEKQWPGMKTELEGYAKKVTDIKDVDAKAKAEGLVKDLQGQIPAIEKAVGELKNFKTGDFGSMFDQAKKAFDGFGGKLGELKKLIPA